MKIQDVFFFFFWGGGGGQVGGGGDVKQVAQRATIAHLRAIKVSH